jgi:hypothetical protein
MSNTSSRRVVGILASLLEVNRVLLCRDAPVVGQQAGTVRAV